MKEYIIKPGEGYFFINKNKYPKGHYHLLNNDARIIIQTQAGHPIAKGDLSNFKNAYGEPFESLDALSAYLDLIFKVGGGGGEGATNIVLTQEEFDAITPDPGKTYDIIEA